MNDNRYYELEFHCGYDKDNKSIWMTVQIEWPRELLDLEYVRNNNPSYHADKYSYYKIVVIHNTPEQRVKDIINEWARIHNIKASDDPHKYMYTQIDDSRFCQIGSNEDGDTYEFCVKSFFTD